MFSSLQLKQFRGYGSAEFEFDAGVNIIVGPNGSGKTSILEALLLLCKGSSYKGQDTDLVQFEQDWLRADAYTNGARRTVKLQIDPYGKATKTYEIDGVKKVRFLHAMQLPVVFFEPQHMNLLVGEPSGRRQFLDDILSAKSATYGALLKNYKRALLQRNTLLKKHSGGTVPPDLFVWDLRLSELGGAIVAERLALVSRFAANLESEYRLLSGKTEAVAVEYVQTVDSTDYTNGLLKKLSENHQKDVLRGFTAYGPHREDFVLTIRGHDAKVSASRGETRSLLLALKVLEVREIESYSNQKPILLLDDVFSELDGRRRIALAQTLQGHQAFITTTDADLVVEHFTDKAHIIAL